MRIPSTFGAAIRALAFTTLALAWSVTAHAAIVDARFSGTVASQTGTTFVVGSAISGEFVYDTVAARYLSFMIGGLSVAPGYTSTASVTPDRYSAIYEAQVSPLGGGSVNSTFSLDLEGLVPWSTLDAIALLRGGSALIANLDTTFSGFGFYQANADGTGVRSLAASLGVIGVTAIPEPATALLALIGLIAMSPGFRRPRR